jgi:hypothetical protein
VSKRFTDTNIWDKPWYRQLTPTDKIAFKYITEKCDSVGVWTPDFEAADFFIGTAVDWQRLPEKVNGNIDILENGKWWLVDFCNFQYGQLNEGCPPHRMYISLLYKHGVHERVFKGYSKGFNTPQEKEKNINISRTSKKTREEGKDNREDSKLIYHDDFVECWKIYPKKLGKQRAYKAYVTRRRQGVDKADLLLACVNYKRSMNGTDETYIKHASTFFGPDEHWRDYLQGLGEEERGPKVVDEG